MKRIGAAALLAAGISLFAACAHSITMLTVMSNKNKGGPDTYVTLAMIDSSCVVTDGVGTLGGKKNGKVVWHVNNGCSTAQYLVFTHYQKYLTDPPDPTKLGPVETDVVTPDPRSSDKVRAGAAGEKVKGEIAKANSGSTYDDVYKYWICTSPNPIPNPLPNPLPSTIKCLDPDVDIWP
jgi:hypothetical protein